VAQDRGSWWALANAVMNLQDNTMERFSGLTQDLLASREGLCSMELVT